MKLKKFLSTAAFFSVALFISLPLFSCQDEETEVTNPEPTDTLEVDSRLVLLINRTITAEDIDFKIECVDFVYPISISIFDTAFDIASTEEIESDAQFSFFLERLEEESLIASINYPISTVFAGESTAVEISDNLGLQNTLLDGQGANCNEPISVQDCTQANTTENLKNCNWNINRYSVNENFENFSINFHEGVEGVTISISDNTGVTHLGDWEVLEEDNLLKLKISTQIIDFNWEIVECGDDFIQARGDEGTIILAKDCTEEDLEITTANELIVNDGCVWQMDRYIVGEDRPFDSLVGRTFEFNDQGTFVFNDVDTLFRGEWRFEKDDDGNLVLILDPFQSLPAYIDFDFTIDTLREGFMLWNANSTEEGIITGFEQICL